MSATSQILRKAIGPDGGYSCRSGIYLRSGSPDFPALPERMLDGGEILKNSRSVVSGFDPEHRYFVKEYRKNGFWRTLKRAVQFPRSYRCLAAALRLQELGVDTPTVLLASRYGLVTEILSGVQFLPENPELAREIVPLLAKLHDGGIRHGDFNLRNIYRNADGKFGVIDLDGSRLYRGEVPEKVRFLELARLVSSYLKCISYEVDDVPLITADFAAAYYRITKHDLFGKPLLLRILDLAARR